MKTEETQNRGCFAQETAIAEIRREIEPGKMNVYRAVWRAIKETQDDYGRPSYKIPCPSLFCDESVYAVTLDELDAIRKGDHVCEFCRDHGGRSARLIAYERQCPRVFREGETKTNPRRLENLDKVLSAWGDSAIPSQSIFIFGETGTRKSRTLWEVLRLRVLPSRASFRVLGGGEFRELLLGVAGDYGRVNAVKQRLVDVDILAFDDFAQDVLTDTMRADLWSILDKRFRNGSKTVFLSNIGPKRFSEKLGGDYVARSLVRRIRDYAATFEFKV